MFENDADGNALEYATTGNTCTLKSPTEDWTWWPQSSICRIRGACHVIEKKVKAHLCVREEPDYPNVGSMWSMCLIG